MVEQSEGQWHPSTPESRRARLAGTWQHHRVWLIPGALLFLWLTVLAFVQPYDPDEALYKIVAKGITDGRWPYREFFDQKPPLIFLWYLPAGFGASIEAQRILAAFLMVGSVGVVASLAKRWLAPQEVPLAVAAYCLFLANPLMEVKANTQAFMLLPLTAAFATPSPFAGGALLGVAALTNPLALAFAPLLLLLRRPRCLPVAFGMTTALIIVLAAFLPIVRHLWESIVWIPLQYGQQVSLTQRLRLFLVFNPIVLLSALPLWVAAAVGIFLHRRRPQVWLWIVGGWVAVKATGYDYPYYYAALAPGAALLAGHGLERLLRLRPSSRVLLGALAGLISILVVVAGLVYEVRKERGYVALGKAARTIEGELYVLGTQTQIYEYAESYPERRFFFTIPLVLWPPWGQQVKEELLSCPPDLLIVLQEAAILSDRGWLGPVEDYGRLAFAALWPESDFRVGWQTELTSLYGQRQDLAAGSIYTGPRRPCAD